MNSLSPILLVDDNIHDAELTITALAMNKTANEIVMVRDGEEALDYLYGRGNFEHQETVLPAVIFLDLKMPKVDGLDVLRIVKRDPRLKIIPIVILTSSREDRDVITSYELGVNSYVVKPVELERFIKTVGQLGMFWTTINEPSPVIPDAPPAEMALAEISMR